MTTNQATFIERLAATMPAEVLTEFRVIEQLLLARQMDCVGMAEYPPVSGDPNGERACGDCLCDVCGRPYFDHPMDWRVIGYGNVPFLNVLCDGRRVKL